MVYDYDRSDKPLTTEEKRDLTLANTWAMDVEADDGHLPKRIDELTSKKHLKPSEARELIAWFRSTAPGNYG